MSNERLREFIALRMQQAGDTLREARILRVLHGARALLRGKPRKTL